MSQFVQSHVPSPSRECRSAGDYSACFYPGFVRRLAVRQPDGSEVLLYEQDGTFYLPAGAEAPWPSSEVEFTRSEARTLRLQVDDPHRQIERIEVVFKADGESSGGDGETLVIWDSPVTCPPHC